MLFSYKVVNLVLTTKFKKISFYLTNFFKNICHFFLNNVKYIYKNKERQDMEKNFKKDIQFMAPSKMKLWEVLAYFIIYSIAGYIIETIFALVRYGVLESRQSFLYGPFCSIYGIGAIIMITFLQYFMKNRMTLFVGGFLIGSITEYLISLIGELILHVKWWDYSNMPLNINGRICFYYSIFWGI